MPCTTCIAAMIGVALLFFGFLFSQSLSPSGNIVETEKTVDFSLFGEPHQHDVPARLRKKMVAMLTADVKDADAAAGLLHPAAERSSTKDPMTLDEVTSYLEKFLHELHRVFVERKHSNIWQIWESYEQLVEKTLYKWDQEYLQRMPPRREDGSIFLSLASYRDENCLNTITWAYEKSRNPEKLFVGLVQQNCDAGCHSGLLEDGKMIPAEPDEDCHKVFCESDLGRPHCEAGRVRALHVNETESLGPYAARYFGSKLWYGESWYMQIDAHMTFAQDWDASSLEMLHTAPSRKPIISHYPPPHTVNFTEAKEKAAARLCGPVFASSVLESQIIRLEGLAFYDRTLQKVPKFAPFAAAGYFVAHSGKSYEGVENLFIFISMKLSSLVFVVCMSLHPFQML
uniref:Uncharacterized protein n=1 Tax=Corethron hystrix TaxID=216773 RepID=A0A6U5LLC7_9STRA